MPAKPAQLPPDSATILERSRGVLFAQWEELLRLRRAVIKSSDVDDIHDLRVASRRLRAALDLYYPIASKDATTELRKSVRNLTRILGALRNIDEAILFFQSRNPTGFPGDDTLFLQLAELRTKELKKIVKALKSFDQRSLDRSVREVVAGLTEDRIPEKNRFSLLGYFSDISIRMYLPIHQLLTVSMAPDQPSSRHALRIAIKKWRYFFEIVARVLDRDYAQILELLKEYQSILGRMNDIAEFGLLLHKMDLSPDLRDEVEATLQTEDTLLLTSLAELIERKPLAYTFLI